ncbi:beta subunit of gdp-forming succinate-CoA ligase [Trichoderma citrinoviride]|uniref:Beta subunit of gdp-forming succinate-CoA ligase n=1 Tax=Trichoderma citrinoviride TaxID=58853 RepID=A0A2T4AY71_9HYPO|nr:beta subunit of gdp-forming succinate-CoA ligase [Trichoderma citrinoviride]PTB62019.1 beta subunit of gdp-forming succinate-CoA ligase [Trichoderma citrinoviride]
MNLSRTTIARAGVLTRPPKLASTKQQLRQLTLHGHDTQQLLRSHGIPVPRAILAQTPFEARDAVRALGKSCVLRAQVLHGDLDKLLFEGGLRGGMQTVDSPEQGLDTAARMLNRQAISENTRHRSLTVKQVLVSERLAHEEQWYLAMTIDRENYCPMIIFSKCDNDGSKGNISGNNISGKGTSFTFGFSQGITEGLVSQIARHLGIVDADDTNLDDILTRAYRIFKETDATLLEINPLARLDSGLFTCLDARLVVDDDAAHRQPDLFRLRDTSQEVHDEVRAEQHNLVYIKLTGNIGNIVNGAGLAMATNDAIGLHGGASANFLDAGGQATKETMIQALGIVLGDKRVKAILINIYGGITRCDMIAESIIGAAQEMTLAVPLVVRLQGTNSAQGLKLLADADLGLHVESDFGRAAQKAVQLAGDSS